MVISFINSWCLTFGMSFIRVKSVKSYRYAYLVENRWKRRGARGTRQKVVQYLGRVVHLEKVRDAEFLSFVENTDLQDYLGSDKKTIVKDLVRFELFRLGFEEQSGKMIKDSFVFDMKRGKFVNSQDEMTRIVIELNEGFFCRYTLHRLLTFKSMAQEDERERGIRLARYFLEAGLVVPREVFVGYFEKV